MRQTLVRGLLVGAVAGVLAFLFAYLVGEPAIAQAIQFEEAHSGAGAHGHGMAAVGHAHAHMEPLVSRSVQSTLGLGVGMLVFGVASRSLRMRTRGPRRGRFSGTALRTCCTITMYVNSGSDVATTVPAGEYRANLRRWHERARAGEEIVVTDNGEPTVRVTSAAAESLLVRLEQEGLLRRAPGRRPASEIVSVPAGGDSAATVSAQRDR